MERVLWNSDSEEKKIPLFLSFFCTPTNLATWHGQSQCEVAFLRYSHNPHPTPVMGPSSHSCKLNPWCHFLLDDVMWWDCDCVAWRGVDWYLSTLSLYILPSSDIYILYIVYWQFVECSKTMPFLAVVHNVTDVLTGWLIISGSCLLPFVLLYRVPLWCFTFSCGVHVYGCTVFSISLLLYIHINVFFLQKTMIFFSQSLQKGPFSPLWSTAV